MPDKFFKIYPAVEYRMFVEAWFFLAISRFLISWIPFRKLLPLLGTQVSKEEAEIAASTPVAPRELLEQIRISVLRACRRSPWRTKCFEQALSVRLMLRRRNFKSVVYFGVCMVQTAKKERMTAHSWLKCSGIVVTGGKNNEMFAVVGRFLV